MNKKTLIWVIAAIILLAIAFTLLTGSGGVEESENDANTAVNELSEQDQGKIPTSAEGLIDESGFISDSDDVDIGDVIE
jgi:hypothetical protein|tara:strand:- start:141 stop:377 length:237 start_codon:yes stop_codon:yes gene_type:complete